MKQFCRQWTGWKWMMLVCGFANLCVGQTTESRPKITVRLDSLGPASEREVMIMEKSVSAIFGDAGVRVVWLDCPTTARVRCDAIDRANVFGRSLIRLRIVDHVDRGGVHTLGWTVPGSSATTVQYGLARRMANASTLGVSPGLILGHAAAHEIGHVLLRSNTHSLCGVMRASYSYADIVKMGQGRLFFSSEESRALRVGAAQTLVAENVIKTGD